jgi:hypothetical protein
MAPSLVECVRSLTLLVTSVALVSIAACSKRVDSSSRPESQVLVTCSQPATTQLVAETFADSTTPNGVVFAAHHQNSAEAVSLLAALAGPDVNAAFEPTFKTFNALEHAKARAFNVQTIITRMQISERSAVCSARIRFQAHPLEGADEQAWRLAAQTFWDADYTVDLTDDDNELVIRVADATCNGPGCAPGLILADIATKARAAAERTLSSLREQRLTHASPPEPDLSKYIGEHPTQVLEEASVAEKFRVLLGADYARFVDSLSVSTELELMGEHYFGSGCAPHVCNIEEGAFTIHKSTGKVVAAQLTEGKQIRLFGASSSADLPGPLHEWFDEHSLK